MAYVHRRVVAGQTVEHRKMQSYFRLKCRKCGECMFIKLAAQPGKTARRKCECGEVAVIRATQTDGRPTAEIISGDMEPG